MGGVGGDCDDCTVSRELLGHSHSDIEPRGGRCASQIIRTAAFMALVRLVSAIWSLTPPCELGLVQAALTCSVENPVAVSKAFCVSACPLFLKPFHSNLGDVRPQSPIGELRVGSHAEDRRSIAQYDACAGGFDLYQ